MARSRREAAYRVAFLLPAPLDNEAFRALQRELWRGPLSAPALKGSVFVARGAPPGHRPSGEVLLPGTAVEDDARAVAEWLQQQPLPREVRIVPRAGADPGVLPPAT